MNRQNFIQSGGFPLQTETLNEMQKAYELFNSLGNIVGNFSIISGCVTTGALVSDGVVYINGEVLEFRGGQLGTDVIIGEEITAQEFEDSNDKDVVYIRYATFGLGAISFPWINFKRPKTTIELTEQKAEQTLIDTLITRILALEARPQSNVPIGLIAVWDRPANEIPTGWVEYQALRGRMPIGLDPAYDSNTSLDLTNYNLQTLNYNGGKREHKLTVPEMPAHNHSPGGDSSFCAHGPNGISAGGDNIGFSGIATQGQDKAHTNMSPYRVVHFIKYTG